MAVKTPALEIIPPMMHPEFSGRVPSRELFQLPPEWFHTGTGAVYGHFPIRPNDNDLTKQHSGPPLGQRITVSGRVLDSDGRAVPNTLIEIWQANASGRYADKYSGRPGLALDPNFTGAGRCITDSEGRYNFTTIKPSPYAGREGTTLPYRASHIHFSVFGPNLTSRLGTTCYFEHDPLFPDFVVQQLTDPRAQERLLARFDKALLKIAGPASSVGYRWDIVLRGRSQTPFESGA